MRREWLKIEKFILYTFCYLYVLIKTHYQTWAKEKVAVYLKVGIMVYHSSP